MNLTSMQRPSGLVPSAAPESAHRAQQGTPPRFGMLPLAMPTPGAQKVNMAAKGLLPRLSNGLQNSGQRLWDSLILMTAANVVPVLGHLTLWPLAAATGALAVKDFFQGAHLGVNAMAQAKARFPKAIETLKSLEGPFNQAAAGGFRWVDKVMPAIYAGLGLFLAGMVFHPLLIVGGPMLLIHPLAYTGGYLKNFAIHAAKVLSKAA